ncbi:MAG TPA: response regulator [Chitinophagaceae bacterium]|nr:response regulator [Chitinophagaceae bacterium]
MKIKLEKLSNLSKMFTSNLRQIDKTPLFFLADDDADDQELFKEALSEIDKSIRCLTASSGEEALNKLKTDLKQLPDYIFLDLNMPRMNGLECLVEIKKTNTLKHIPVIIYSTSSAEKDVEETRKLGADYFITKPPGFKELCDKIKYILSGKWTHENSQPDYQS